jgi:hypothetical protein
MVKVGWWLRIQELEKVDWSQRSMFAYYEIFKEG